MANVMFGWSAQDVLALVQTCGRFIEAYRSGPGGASTHLRSFALQVQSCQGILTSIHDELQEQDREFFYSKFQRDSLKDTLEQCEKVFIKSEFLKPTEEQKILSKAGAAAKWLYCDEAKVIKLSKILEGHINYVGVFLQLLQSKNTQKQNAHLESHGKHLEVQTAILRKHDEHLQRQGEHIQKIHDFLLSQQEPRWLNQTQRAQSVIDVPSTPSSSAVAYTEVYFQTRKQLSDVEDLLEQVSSEIHDPQRTEEEKVVLRSVQKELEEVEERINKSLERNEAKGVQIARQNRENRERRRSKVPLRQDSGYPASVGSFDIHRTSQYSISSASSVSSAIAGKRTSQASIPRDLDGQPQSPSYAPNQPSSPASGSGHSASLSQGNHRASISSEHSNWSQVLLQQGPVLSPEIYQSVQICQAEISFNDGKHKAVPLPCTCCGKYQDDKLCEIYPEYAGKLLGQWESPAIKLDQRGSRPIPHITPRGPNSIPGRYPVQILGNTTIVPVMRSLQYVFKTPNDSKLFEELIFNKDLVLDEPITVLKLRSKRTKESDATALRIWKARSLMPSRKDYSLMYHANNVEQAFKEHIEISLEDIEKLTQERKKPLRVEFKNGSLAWKKLQFLEFELARKVADENPKGIW